MSYLADIPNGTSFLSVRQRINHLSKRTCNIRDFDPLAGSSAAYNCTAAFVAFMAYAESLSFVALAMGPGANDPTGGVVLDLPPGAYLIKSKEALIRSSFNTKRQGLAFRGAGSHLTTIIYSPTTMDGATPETPLMVNDAWLGLRFTGIKFVCDSAKPGCTFMHSNAILAQQDYVFNDVTWAGSWGRAFFLTGPNNNSEFRFIACGAAGFSRFPFLESVESDQFLNYWFYGMSYTSSDMPLVRMTKGGHVHIYGLDASDWGTRVGTGGIYPTEAYLFELIGATHARGVCSFTAAHVRVEAKNTAAYLLKCEWPQGIVAFRGVDYSSQVNNYTYGDIINIAAGQGNARISFDDSELAGGVRVSYGSSEYAANAKITFQRCSWLQKQRPSEIVTYTDGTNIGGRPNVRFRDCVTQYVYTTGHKAAWDFDSAARHNAGMNIDEKVFSLRASNTAILSTYNQRVILPIGAVITRFRAIAKPGQSVETTTATYTLRTTDATPVVVGQVSYANPSLGGDAVETRTSLPFFCDTATTATLDIVAEADVSQINYDLMFLIHYI